MKRIRKAVIPAAGLGTRFLPVTKAIPKEMLPIVDVPTIQLIVEEAVASGLEEIILVTARGKDAIANHFDTHYELEDSLERRGKHELAEISRAISRMARVITVRQQLPLGLGHAVLCAEDAVGNEPFAVLLGDDIIDADPACTRQLIDQFQTQSVVGVMEVPAAEVSKYGIVKSDPVSGSSRLSRVRDVIEKPAVGAAPSRLAIPGRYILTPGVFTALRAVEKQYLARKSGEIQLTDALKILADSEGLLAYEFDGVRFDAGDRLGYLEANLAYALRRPELASGVRALLKKYLSEDV